MNDTIIAAKSHPGESKFAKTPMFYVPQCVPQFLTCIGVYEGV